MIFFVLIRRIGAAEKYHVIITCNSPSSQPEVMEDSHGRESDRTVLYTTVNTANTM